MRFLKNASKKNSQGEGIWYLKNDLQIAAEYFGRVFQKI